MAESDSDDELEQILHSESGFQKALGYSLTLKNTQAFLEGPLKDEFGGSGRCNQCEFPVLHCTKAGALIKHKARLVKRKAAAPLLVG